jgi:hypothetical protein
MYKGRNKKMAKRIGLARTQALLEQLKRDMSWGGSTFQNYKRIIEAKTSDYTITLADSGKIFTTEGASGTVVFTLPAPTTSLQGVWVEIVQAAAQDMKITCAAIDSILSQGAVDWDYLENTSATRIGAHAECVCTGTKWIVRVSGTSQGAGLYWTFANQKKK